MARTKSTLTGPSKALWPGMCHLLGGLARLGSTGSFQRSPEPQLLLWPKAASAAVNALRRNRTSGTPKGVPTMWATRGVRESPAHRQSTFLVLEVFAAGTKPRALNSLQCPDDGNARRQKMWKVWTQARKSSRVGGGRSRQRTRPPPCHSFFLSATTTSSQSERTNFWQWPLQQHTVRMSIGRSFRWCGAFKDHFPPVAALAPTKKFRAA